MKKLIAFGVLALAMAAGAQAPRRGPDPAELEAMKKLEFLVGRWEGTGWIQFGERKFDFAGSETVQAKLNGRVLLVEGDFSSEVQGKRVPVHQTLAVISRDQQQGQYRFRTWLASGGSGDHELKLLESPQGFEWTTSSGMRFTMKLENGEWVEAGERPGEGGGWIRFFEMRLKKMG